MESGLDNHSELHQYSKTLMVALGYRDMLTRIHCERVLGISTAIGMHMGLSRKDLSILKIGSLLHDIGKISIPDETLLKPAQLSEAEWVVMKQHSAIGEEILVQSKLDGSIEAAEVVRYHHEQFDGRGYPDGLSGENIPVTARIVGIADSYAAMEAARPYHIPRKHTDIMRILHKETGRKHDPKIMGIFREIIE